MQIDELLSRLDKVRGKHPQWQALCPAHDDHGPSLSIGIKTHGRIVFNCLAGCDKFAVIRALGIEFDDLYPDHPIHRATMYVGQKGNQRWIDSSAVLKAIEQELYVQAIASSDIAAGRKLSDAQNLRRRESAARIKDALRYARSLR